MALSKFVLAIFLLLGVAAFAQEHQKPILAIGSPAPDFCLRGVDGQQHCLRDYASRKLLVIAFICNHCPTSQLYEKRIQQLADDYRDKNVALVAIEPSTLR